MAAINSGGIPGGRGPNKATEFASTEFVAPPAYDAADDAWFPAMLPVMVSIAAMALPILGQSAGSGGDSGQSLAPVEDQAFLPAMPPAQKPPYLTATLVLDDLSFVVDLDDWRPAPPAMVRPIASPLYATDELATPAVFAPDDDAFQLTLPPPLPVIGQGAGSAGESGTAQLVDEDPWQAPRAIPVPPTLAQGGAADEYPTPPVAFALDDVGYQPPLPIVGVTIGQAAGSSGELGNAAASGPLDDDSSYGVPIMGTPSTQAILLWIVSEDFVSIFDETETWRPLNPILLPPKGLQPWQYADQEWVQFVAAPVEDDAFQPQQRRVPSVLTLWAPEDEWTHNAPVQDDAYQPSAPILPPAIRLWLGEDEYPTPPTPFGLLEEAYSPSYPRPWPQPVHGHPQWDDGVFGPSPIQYAYFYRDESAPRYTFRVASGAVYDFTDLSEALLTYDDESGTS